MGLRVSVCVCERALVHEEEALTLLYSHSFSSLGEKKKLLPPAGANKTAGTMYGKIGKEKKLSISSGEPCGESVCTERTG